MKKSSLFLLGMLALTLTFGLVFTACPTEDDDSSSSGGSIPSELIAIWYFDFNENGTVDSTEGTTPAYEFKSDGKLLIGGTYDELPFSVSGNKITLFISGTPATEPITFSITGKSLTLTGSAVSGFAPGKYAKK